MLSAIFIFISFSVTLVLWLTHIRFTTRISPCIPYAGEESVLSRFRAIAGFCSNPIAFLVEQRKKLGDVFCVDLLVLKIVYFLGPEGNKAILSASEEELSIFENVKNFFGLTPPEVWDENWMNHGFRILRTGLMSATSLQDYARSCDGLAEGFLEAWSNTPKGTVPLFRSFSDLVYSYAIVILVGKAFYIEHGTTVIPLLRDFIEVQKDPLLLCCPHRFWKFLPSGKKGFRIQNRLYDILSPVVLEHFQQKCQNMPVDDSTLAGLLCKNSEEKYSRHIIYTVIYVCAAIHFNLARTVPWLLLHASRVPGTIDRLRTEVEEENSFSARGMGPYLEACLRETGRLYTAWGILRSVIGDHEKPYVSVLNHRIPKGAIVAASPVVTQQDSNLFDSPHKWYPERFLADGGKQYVKWFQRYEFVQFGSGAHACIGEKMTRSITFNVIMATLLRKYKFEVVSGLRENVGIDGIGIEVDWNNEPVGTPPAKGEVMVRFSTLV